MNAFTYGLLLQWKLDIRSKSLLITCYGVPLIFFLLMGGIFTSMGPEVKHTLIPAMIILGVSMGSLIGLPPSLSETCSPSVKKVFRANGVPLYLPLAALFLSAFLHLMLLSVLILLLAPALFDAVPPANLFLFFAALAVYTAVSLSIGCALGLALQNQAKLVMFSQLFFLPSIMLSGIMFPSEFLPDFLRKAGLIFPASWGYSLMLDQGFAFRNLWPLLLIGAAAVLLWNPLLKKQH